MTPKLYTSDPQNPKDTLEEIAWQLLTMRNRCEEAIKQQKLAYTETQDRINTAYREEREVLAQHRPALLQALLDREDASELPRIECAAGVLRLVDNPGRVTIENFDQLLSWTQHTTGDLIFLGATLSEADLVNSFHDEEPKREVDLTEAEGLVTQFYHRTGLLPEGCHLLPPSREPVLE